MFFESKDPQLADEIMRAALLYSRLNDEDVRSGLCEMFCRSAVRSLSEDRGGLKGSICLLGAHTVLDNFIAKNWEIFEICPVWLQNFKSAEEHFWERVYSRMSWRDMAVFDKSHAYVHNTVKRILVDNLSCDNFRVEDVIKIGQTHI